MKLRFALILLLLTAGAFPASRVQRSMLIPVERSFDARIERFSVDDPIYLLGASHGVYLEGFGLLLSAEVDLIPTSTITPFRQSFTKEEKARIRTKKLERIGKIKEIMRGMLVDAAAMVDTIPNDEQIAVAVTLLHKSFEDTTGFPAQIVMQASRKALVDLKTAPSSAKSSAAFEAALKVREY